MTTKQIQDAAAGLAFLEGQLAMIENTVYQTPYQNLNYKEVVPVSNENGEWATSITYYYMDGRTVAKFVGTNAMDAPISEIGTRKVTVAVALAQVAYNYSKEEIRQAIHLKRNLPQLKATMAIRAYEELAQRTCMTGSTEYNLPGFINNLNVTAGTVAATGTGANTEWSTKTAEQKLIDINALLGGIYTDTRQIERPDTLALPTDQWNQIATERLSGTSDKTVLEWLADSSPYLKSKENILSLPELAEAGATSSDRMIGYTHDINKVVFHMPMLLRFDAPLPVRGGWEILGEGKMSGVEFRLPGSARYADGI